ncbi:uncharacterized protein LOC127750967 [Frankliniella occidentalis]|uniref:Uncharacterized protein LOC127750967 n=1 Tax=Frankliniella occidentalis TaxID=133901 RepID=A0A9C6XSR8_FRAOC|nr:uncharacterized protein LOC127750967 [Frankliniella occidentalis]
MGVLGCAKNVAKELKRMGIAIVGLQEIRWPGQGELIMGDYKYFYSGGTQKVHGVGFAVHRSLLPAMFGFQPRGKRIAALRMRTETHTISFVTCHAPCQSEKGLEEKGQFYESLLRLVHNELPSGSVKIILGDMNAQLGPPATPLDKSRGYYTYHKKDNSNGARLVSFANAASMTVVSTTSSRPRSERYTWTSNNCKDVSQIDHILIDTLRRNWVTGVRTDWTACNYSDHAAVVATLKVKVEHFKREREHDMLKSPKKLRLERLNNPEVKEEFQKSVTRLLQEGSTEAKEQPEGPASDTTLPDKPPRETIHAMWEWMASALLVSGKSTLGEAKQTKGKHWYDEECDEVTEQRNAIWRWHREEVHNEDIREGYEEMERMRKKTLRRVRRRYLKQICEDLELDHSLQNVRGFFAKEM